MSQRRMSKVLSILLAVIMTFALCVPGLALRKNDFPSDALSGLSVQQRSALSSLRSVSGRSGGLIGFNGDFTLVDTDAVVHVIVEFVNQPAPVAVMEAKVAKKQLTLGAAKSLASKDHSAFQTALNKMFGNQTNAKGGKQAFSISDSWMNAFNGVAMSLPASRVDELSEIDCVFAVYPDIEVFADAQEPSVTADPSQTGNAAGRAQMGVDDLHAMGITGKGVKVAVIDTGTDYNHPDLKDNFKGGHNFVDFVKFYAADPSENPYPGLPARAENDPMETTYADYLATSANNNGLPVPSAANFFTAHGTHVSGTVASKGVHQPTSSLGMAPDADLYVYRVLGPGGSGMSSWTVAGINQAVLDGIEVANLSLGANVDEPYYPSSVAINNAIIGTDMVFAVSAGNNGSYGLSSVGAPGTSSMAITVANASASPPNTLLIGKTGELEQELCLLYGTSEASYADNADGTVSVLFKNLNITEDNKVKLVATATNGAGRVTGTGAAAEYTDEVKAAVAGNIVVVVRGNAFLDTARDAYLAGAGGVILINNNITTPANTYAALLPYRGLLDETAPFWTVEQAAGEAFWAAAQQNGGYIQFIERTGAPVNLSSGSSRGPSGAGDIKPDITSHGTSVISTAPFYVNNRNGTGEDIYESGYQSLSGTSMASPHIAGVATLLRGYSKDNNLGWSSFQIKSRLMNNAKNINSTLLNTNLGVYEQGSGYANAKAALLAPSYVSVVYDGVITGTAKAPVYVSGETGSFSFGSVLYDSPAPTRTLTGIIHNASDVEKTYSISHAFNKLGLGVKNPEDMLAALDHAETVTVPAGGQTTFEVTFSMEAPAAANVGSYEGYVTVTAPGEKYNLPFAFNVQNGIIATLFNDIYFARPVISGGTDAQLSASTNTDLVVNVRANFNQMYLTLVDGTTHRELGEFIYGDSYRLNNNNMLPRNSLKVVPNFLNSSYYPYIDDNAEFLSPDAVPLEAGYYILRMYCVTSGGSLLGAQNLPFYVDGDAPVLDVSEDISEAITGTVSDAGALALDAVDGIRYKTLTPPANVGSAFNALFMDRDGTKTRVDLAADGSFSIPVDTAAAPYDITLYALDHFAPSSSLITSGSETFDPSAPYAADGKFWFGANITTKTITVKDPNAAVITSVSVSTPNILSTLKAYLNISVAGENLDAADLSASLMVNGAPLYTVPVVNGSARMTVEAAPDVGVYQLVVTDSKSAASGSCGINVAQYDTNIWNVNLIFRENTQLGIQFNADITARDGKFDNEVTINGVISPCVKADATSLTVPGVTSETLADGSKIVITGVKFAQLFPSYSFTFTANYSK